MGRTTLRKISRRGDAQAIAAGTPRVSAGGGALACHGVGTEIIIGAVDAEPKCHVGLTEVDSGRYGAQAYAADHAIIA